MSGEVNISFVVRYADDFVVLVDGTREQAEAEKLALAEFLKMELRMELSMEKTGVTDIREGFDFLGYRVVQAKALHTGHRVGKLFIPKRKLNDLRHKIKVMVKGIPTGCPLAEVIGDLNPVILGWRNYYRYAIRAYREFSHLDYWIWQRVGRWLRRKHGKATWPMLRRRYYLSAPGQRRQWTEGTKRLRFFSDGGTMRYPLRSIDKMNRWDVRLDREVRENVLAFWKASKHLSQNWGPPVVE